MKRILGLFFHWRPSFTVENGHSHLRLYFLFYRSNRAVALMVLLIECLFYGQLISGLVLRMKHLPKNASCKSNQFPTSLFFPRMYFQIAYSTCSWRCVEYCSILLVGEIFQLNTTCELFRIKLWSFHFRMSVTRSRTSSSWS